MPRTIVTETCPAPQCNLSEQDIEEFLDEMKDYIDLFAPAFPRAEQVKRSKMYVRGLLGDALRKNVEQIALEMGANVRICNTSSGKVPGNRAHDCHPPTTGGRDIG